MHCAVATYAAAAAVCMVGAPLCDLLKCGGVKQQSCASLFSSPRNHTKILNQLGDGVNTSRWECTCSRRGARSNYKSEVNTGTASRRHSFPKTMLLSALFLQYFCFFFGLHSNCELDRWKHECPNPVIRRLKCRSDLVVCKRGRLRVDARAIGSGICPKTNII